MNEKMVRFLKSLNIENLDDFDMDFDMVGRNRFNHEQIDMIITKKTPWKYHLLRKFQDALQEVKYPYYLRFSYLVRPDFNDVNHLFGEWYQTLYRLPHNLIIEGDESGLIKVEYSSEAEKEQYHQIIEDFRDFLKFLSYDFVIKEEVIQLEEVPEISKRMLNKINKSAEIEAEESIADSEETPQISDRNDVLALQEEEKREMNRIVEDTLLEMMKKNYEEMKKERERARLNKRGNYTPIDNIDSITAQSGSVDFNGTVFSVETNVYGGKTRLNLGVHDDLGGAIFVNKYCTSENDLETLKKLERGTNVRIRGVAYNDEYSKALLIKGHNIDLLPPDEIEPDPEEVKRVELHLHSNMSSMDGISSMEDYCKYAKALGHTAIAVTDHAVVQSYPDAQKFGKNYGLKVLYGCELYMVDDQLTFIQNPANRPLNNATYVVLDLETTGLSCTYNRIIEFGAVRVEHGIVTSSLDILIDPEVPIPEKITSITDITNEMVHGQPTIEQAMPKILEFLGDAILVTHNAKFDISFLQEALKRMGKPILTNPVIDTLALSRYLFPEANRHSLGSLCRNMDVNYDEDSAHRADYDASVLNDVWQPMIVRLTKDNHDLTHADLAKLVTPPEVLKHIKPYHVTVLVKNREGLKDLYKIVSLSHIEYLARVPKVPRRILEKYRSNLIVGSACFNGEVFETARYYNNEVLKDVIKFYDYIEIQPLECYSFLVNMGELEQDELISHVKDIVNCADSLNKTIVATGDVHYARKKDKIFRDVYISAKGIGGVAHPLNPYARNKMKPFENPDQHYLRTDEMLQAMSFLGEEKAREITITNTNKIADMIEPIDPIPSGKLFTPTIENCEQMLRDLAYEGAYKLYGNPIPEVIKNRLDTELNGIIKNGYSVIYYIAHKIVKKTLDDGYIVGSRGSVGSSLVATMTGITEVNPLPPHYICPHCHNLEWTSKTMPEYKSGYDLPNKKCPICGEEMIHDGQNIPFETFLGFNAEKVPDIDLNFPRDYQATAHDYTKVLLGEKNVFRAGTISGVEDKTAFGFARGYIERLGLNPDTYPRAKISYLASGCVGVKRTTGQHPGGIVVIPTQYEVYDFTPVQYPADDVDANWQTTHFDFHSIHDTILKLDLLGHLDPMALKMMCDLTHINYKTIPMNDKKVLSLFSTGSALNMKNDYLGNRTGAMAIPEFGTENSRRILEMTLPKTFSDLVIISGLSHGTDVWSGNAEKLIEEGKATLQEVIGCRDDIMTYLIDKGISSSVAFAIMEDVRKGRGLKPEFVETMKANRVPDFYIESCKKIKYMFPKGHAVAYVTMAIRVGYFKIYYPLEFYATFFST
ncbi:MAG: PolC-type DNA polymerase III, partial [Bacilli bacterium]|nr:PolC-type DNA polymerase III [Bacilli bacterium]